MRKIDFKEFRDIVEREILDYLPEEFQNAEVNISRMEKLGSSYNSMTVTKEKNEVCPAINLDQYYSEYLNGGMLQDCLQRMARMIRDYQREFEVDWIQDYEQVKKHLFIRVSNADKNAGLLKKEPHELKDDLAITCHLEVSNEYGSLMSAIVSNQMLDMYGVSEQQIIQDAIENSVRIMPPKICDIRDVISELSGESIAKEGTPIYVISNETTLNGASAIFYPNVLETVSQKMGGDFLIAPSSIHEVIVLPANYDTDLRELEETVKFINHTQVQESDQLGDHLYKYDSKTHSLESIWSDSLTSEYTNTAFMM